MFPVAETRTPAPVLPDFGVPLQLVHAEDVAAQLRHQSGA